MTDRQVILRARAVYAGLRDLPVKDRYKVVDAIDDIAQAEIAVRKAERKAA